MPIAAFAKIRSGIRSLLSRSRILRCESGNSMMLLGFSLVPVVGIVGLALDGSQWMLWRRQLHTAADLAALAGASAIAKGQKADSAADRALIRNKSRDFKIVKVESPPTSGPYLGKTNAVYIEITTQQSLPFSSMFIATAPVIRVTATAIVRNEVPNCVIALDQAEVTGLEVSGSATVKMNCGMAANAMGSSALVADGDLVDVAALSAVGSVVAGSSVTSGTMVNQGISPVADPYEGRLSLPDLASTCSGATTVSVGVHDVSTIGPGCYANFNVAGTLYLQPGIYYIDAAASGSSAGDVEVGSQGHLAGDGVVLIFTNSDSAPSGGDFGHFKANGTSMIELTAPTTDKYKGVLMYQDRRATPSSATNFFVAGNSGTDNQGKTILSRIQGSIYTPGTDTTMLGNSSLDTDCMQLVARRVEFTGNTEILNTCAAGSGAQAYGGTKIIRLVQ